MTEQISTYFGMILHQSLGQHFEVDWWYPGCNNTHNISILLKEKSHIEWGWATGLTIELALFLQSMHKENCQPTTDMLVINNMAMLHPARNKHWLLALVSSGCYQFWHKSRYESPGTKWHTTWWNQANLQILQSVVKIFGIPTYTVMVLHLFTESENCLIRPQDSIDVCWTIFKQMWRNFACF